MTDAEKRALRDAFGQFATGVTIATTRGRDGAPRGFTANSFTSVSLDPPLLLVCIAKSASSCDAFCEAEHFAVNVLSEEQKQVSGLFASRSDDKFAQADWTVGAHDLPLIPGSIATFVCARQEVIDAGDHVVLMGLVEAAQTHDAPPLGYHKGSYFSIGLEDRLVDAAARSGTARIGAIMERDGALLLRHHPGGAVSIPFAPENECSLSGLTRKIATLGLTATLDHLYAVYEEAGSHVIVYHGTASGPVPEGLVPTPLSAIPLEAVQSKAQRSMLARYREEYQHGQFGIYQGPKDGGETGLIHQVTGRAIVKS
ncbi:flavin reductase family protein [Roseovarius sp. LXJ103]|uniref:flavin reductase family protein n=1 Tax=Roseovarius carneus TaxID=2853164 RepID=UPI000D6181D8|nr:flavin reductase family protein [Roseovarius carneus]MBZ8117567.1 flavin reductase family protein [Roseovarius carneus]PWE36640.1 flavin reductase [Pelagicola sp. LXJ1103]